MLLSTDVLDTYFSCEMTGKITHFLLNQISVMHVGQRWKVPRNISHMDWAKEDACVSLLKPTLPVPPPRLSVTIFPLAWHFLMSGARNEQSARLVSGKVLLSHWLQIFVEAFRISCRYN